MNCYLQNANPGTPYRWSFSQLNKVNSLLLLAFLFSFSAFSQKTVTGRVTSSDSSIASVTVEVKNSKLGTQTDANGQYSISAPANGILIFSHVGFESQEIAVKDRSKINIQLIREASQMADVIVVGYGTQKKADVTGAITTISPDKFKSIPSTDVVQALAGKVAGLNITQNNAIPGVTPSVMIRGQNSISANTSPLIVLDGVPYSGNVNSINPNDIAGISVLKGPSATAIYGTRGSNGVILVTTKKGKKGKASISYSGYAGTGTYSHELKPSTPQEYLQKYKWYQLETNVPQNQLSPVPNAPGGNEYLNYQAGKTVNWLNEVSQPAYITDNN